MAGTLHEEEGGALWGQQQQQPDWFTPRRLLVLFCCINMLNYLDRGTIARNGVNGVPGDAGCLKDETCFHGSGIQGKFGLMYFQDGVLSSPVMVGLLAASPVFAYLSKTLNPFRLIGFGLSVWVSATAGCGFSVGFWSIMSFRMFVAVGEASFVSLATPCILDVAPPSQKSSWMSIFYMFTPVDMPWATSMKKRFKLFMLAGSLDKLEAIPQSDAEALHIPTEDFLPALMLSFIYQYNHWVALDLPEPLAGDEAKNKDTTFLSGGLLSGVKELAMCKIYTTNIFGYTVYTFVLGAYAYWGPKALAMAISTVLDTHFGRCAISSIVSAFQDWVHNWRLIYLILTSVLFLATATWGTRSLFSVLDKETVETKKSPEAPLLTPE